VIETILSSRLMMIKSAHIRSYYQARMLLWIVNEVDFSEVDF